MQLISMTDFFLEQNYDGNSTQKYLNELQLIHNYANFLKQPLKLEMFVTCDDEGNVLEEPDADYYMMVTEEKVKQYQQSKEKVLFDGFENLFFVTYQYNEDGECLEIDKGFCERHIIEDLILFDLTLTESALKQIGLCQ